MAGEDHGARSGRLRASAPTPRPRWRIVCRSSRSPRSWRCLRQRPQPLRRHRTSLRGRHLEAAGLEEIAAHSSFAPPARRCCRYRRDRPAGDGRACSRIPPRHRAVPRTLRRRDAPRAAPSTAGWLPFGTSSSAICPSVAPASAATIAAAVSRPLPAGTPAKVSSTVGRPCWLPPVGQPLRRRPGELPIVRLLLLGAVSVSVGCSLTPVTATLRAAMSFSRAASVGLICSAHPAAGDRLDHAALRLDLLEHRPGASWRLRWCTTRCTRSRRPDRPPAADGIPSARISCVLRALRRLASRRQAGRRVERRGGDDVGAGHRAGIAGDRVAQDVERLVARGQHAPAGGDAQAHLLGMGAAAAWPRSRRPKACAAARIFAMAR